MQSEPTTQLLDKVRKIAVLRANALGDFIFILPAMEALGACYPEAEITLLGQPWHADFLAARPGPVDRVLVVPRSRGVRWKTGEEGMEDEGELERFFAAMQAERFDLAVQLHGGGRYTNPFLKRLGARMTIGLKTPDALPLDRWVPYTYYHHEILRYLEVVALVGARPLGLEPHITVTEADLAESRQVLPDESRPLAALHPGATDPRRCWPVERFAAVGDALAARGAQVVVTGTPPEKDLVEGVVRGMRHSAVGLCGRLSLGGLAGLLSRCSLVVSNDSGPLHLAAAVGSATVGLYWCGNMINAGPLTRTRHRPVISWQLDCPVCGRNCIQDNCGHTGSFLRDISVDEVLDEALDIFDPQPSSVLAPAR